MEMRQVTDKSLEFLKKYRYIILVLIIGIALMVIPETESKNEAFTTSETDHQDIQQTLELRLENVLSQISGAGQVSVVLTTVSEEEIIFQTDQDSEGKRIATVTVTDAQRNESGLVRQIVSPKYRGAVIVCQGADNPVVHLAIVEAVSKATGLGSDRISVLKMK